MYLLAPVAASGGAAKQLGLVQKVFGDHYLAKWGAPPGHLFQPGYPLGKRLVNFAYKGTVFAFIGMCAGLVGTATSNGLLELRKKLDPGFTSPVSRGAARSFGGILWLYSAEDSREGWRQSCLWDGRLAAAAADVTI